MSGVMESNGGDLYRGSATGSGGDYVTYTNTPSKALNDSLGATALSYSYIGLGGLSARAAGSSGAMESHALAMFGGDRTKTTDMPTTGSADYKGAFVGVEQDWRGGAASVVSSRLNGVVNMKADFGAGEVNGIALSRVTFGEVTGLPDPVEGTLYIVSALVRSALPARTDLASPGDLVRDAAGAVIGCKGLIVN